MRVLEATSLECKKSPPGMWGNPPLPPLPTVFPAPPPPCRRAPAPHPTPLRQEISLGSLVSRGLLPSAGLRSIAEAARPRRPAVPAAAQQDAAAPQPPAPLTCTCLRKWRGPGTADGQEQQQQQHRRRRGHRRPRHLVNRAVPWGRLSGRRLQSVGQSVLRAASATLAPAASGHKSLRPNVNLVPGLHPPLWPRNHHHPSRPSAPPPPLNSSNGRHPAEPRAKAAALPPP